MNDYNGLDVYIANRIGDRLSDARRRIDNAGPEQIARWERERKVDRALAHFQTCPYKAPHICDGCKNADELGAARI